MSGPVRFVAGEDASGHRLDRFLADSMPGVSRTTVARLAAQGRVTIGGRPAAASRRVRSGDVVVCDVPEATASDLVGQDLPLSILHEDEDLVVVDKAAGMVVHPGAGHATETLVHALLHHVGPRLRGVGGTLRPGIVHRLDKGTSGVMVVAKNDRAHAALSAQFAARTVEKEYRAVVFGVPAGTGTIDAPIGRSTSDRKRMSTSPGRGRPARSSWTLVEAFRPDAALLAVRLETGRTHQVRVHLASAGHPLVGDATYAGRRARGVSDPRLRSLLSRFPRPALHAFRLAFQHPATGRRLEVIAPMPADLEDLLAALRAA